MRRFTDGNSRELALTQPSTLKSSINLEPISRRLARGRLIPADMQRYSLAETSDRRRQSIPRPVVKAAGFAVPAMAAGLLALGAGLPTHTGEASTIEPAVGSLVVVAGTEGIGLRVRQEPGLDAPRLAILPDGIAVRVMGSARRMNGFSWVPIEDPTGRFPKGWSATKWLLSLAGDKEQLLESEASATSAQGDPQPEAQVSTDPAERFNFTARISAYNGAEYGDPWGGITASGSKVHWGTVAVDPRLIPLGSKLKIEGFDDIFIAEDTGSAIKGQRLDVWFPSVAEANAFGVRYLKVTVLQ